MNTSQAIAEILKIDGVEQAFCFPFTPIVKALAEAGIRPIVARQERVAENMADGRVTIRNGDGGSLIELTTATLGDRLIIRNGTGDAKFADWQSKC